tara:strand:- start:67 stop:741 length:675 start_codon:yes stop_codon:yes gene_type:complete
MYHPTRYRPRQANPVQKDSTIQPRIVAILKESLDLNSKRFAESLLDFCNNNGGLTEKQLSSLKKIESRFSPGEKLKFQQWGKEYESKHRSDALLLAKYYVGTGYWKDLANSILEDPNYIPPKWKYEKMSRNKYAEKILQEDSRQAKFSVNDMIQIRSTAGANASDSRFLRILRHRLCFVLDNSLPIKNAVNGGKRYRVLPMGHSQTIEVEERHIMKPNKKGKTA